MGKIQKLFKALAVVLQKPYMLNLVLEHDTVWEDRLQKSYPEFADGLPVVDLPTVLGTNKFELEGLSFLEGGSSVCDYVLLKYLAKNISNCNYFEIGTFRGESAMNVASSAATVTSLNLSDEELRHLNLSNNLIEQIGILAKDLSNVQLIRGNSFNFNFEQLNKKYDLIFIDGDHHYEAVKNDTEKVFKHLVKPDSIVVWHDYTYQPDKLRPEVFLGILDGIPAEFRSNLIHVKNTNCAVFINKKYEGKKLEYPAKVEGLFRTSVEYFEGSE